MNAVLGYPGLYLAVMALLILVFGGEMFLGWMVALQLPPFLLAVIALLCAQVFMTIKRSAGYLFLAFGAPAVLTIGAGSMLFELGLVPGLMMSLGMLIPFAVIQFLCEGVRSFQMRSDT
jgi:hypothetical protein